MTNEKKSLSMEAGKIDKTSPEGQLSNYYLEDGFYVLKKNSRAGLLIQAAREGKPKRVKKLLEAYPSKSAIEEAMDAALKNNNWEMAQIISDFCKSADFETYSVCLKKQFLKASYNEDVERVKYFLQKLIENIVGELTDETGKHPRNCTGK